MKTSSSLRPRFHYLVLVVAVVVATCPSIGTAADASDAAELKAKWIWRDGADCKAYNQTIVAHKTFRLERPRRATLCITADSFYRLSINGRWIGDGPCRSYPEHFQYDVMDVTSYLRHGENEIAILARYYGVGDFHRVPKQVGLLAQLDVTAADGHTTTIVTDSTWQVALLPALIVNTPKVSIQMEPAELYDARLEEPLAFAPARELFAADEGPWKDLHPRDVALMTRQPFPLKAFLGAKVVKCEALDFCLPAARLVNPGAIEANHNTSCACGMVTILDAPQGCALELQRNGMKVAIDGRQPPDGKSQVAPGRHVVMAMAQGVFGHNKERSLRLMNPKGFALVNPRDPKDTNPWCFIRFPELAFVGNDLLWMAFTGEDPKLTGIISGYDKLSKSLLASVKKPEDIVRQLGTRCEQMPAEQMFVRDVAWQFQQRRVVGDATALVSDPAALMFENPAVTTVRPSPDGDVELLYDLGEQNVGHYSFELLADAGVCVDIFGVEYITPSGRIQHTGDYRNGMRYITHQGINRFTSLKRRSQRYLFLTLRNQRTPVQIRNVQLIESTYPVHTIGSFACSDPRLDKIWEISTRTMKLCMEDTYTDCPLYEQTHWVGDARNESLFGYSVFGATDLAARCIRITGQSLERYPLAGCQTPSCWDCLLPAWSFLWGISNWDYYWATGDTEFLRATWPAVIKNLRGAEKCIDKDGLFSGSYWNLFDWAGIDQNPKAVLHNSMFMVGAIDAALQSAEILGDTTHTAWLKSTRQRLVAGVNRLWDPKKHAYPDSIHADGKPSPSTCQHTSFLSILYDVIEPANIAYARKNLLAPPKGMVRIGSPFAMLYLYETLEKLGLEDEIVREIYRSYLPMLDVEATTVWESFPSGTTGSDGFPTRSHCHAWSAAPCYFLNRVVLGIRPTAPAAATVQISPCLAGLSWARGTVASVRGPITVAWKATDGVLDVTCTAPPGVKVEFAKNASHKDRRVTFNGKPAP
jgi:alpha-L-rhamnosidase